MPKKNKEECTMKRLDDYIADADTIVISGHVRPDGDCIGSTLGCRHYIAANYPEKQVSVYLESFLEAFAVLPDTDVISREYPDRDDIDLFISLDAASEDRLGDARKYLTCAKKTLCIDHHVSNPGFADVNIIEPQASSACEVLCKLLDPQKITYGTAQCLYTGIVHDTGIFQYASTSPETMRIAASLMEYGIDHNLLIDETFNLKTYAQNRIMGKCLDSARLYLDGKVIYTALSAQDLTDYQVETKHLDGIAAMMRQTRGVLVSVFMYPLPDGRYKVSFRSNGTDVSCVAARHGGGGHVRAAGCDMAGTEEEIRTLLLQDLKEVIGS